MLFEIENGVLLKAIADDYDILVTIPEGVREIADSAFKHCLYLRNIVLPETLQKVGDHAFEGCHGMIGVAFQSKYPAAVGDNAFYDCRDLATVLLPERVRSIGAHAFKHCERLTRIWRITSF